MKDLKGNVLILIIGVIFALALMIGPIVQHATAGKGYFLQKQSYATARSVAHDLIAYGTRLIAKNTSIITCNTFHLDDYESYKSNSFQTELSVTREGNGAKVEIFHELYIGPVHWGAPDRSTREQEADILLIARATCNKVTSYAYKRISLLRRPISEFQYFSDFDSEVGNSLDAVFNGPIHINGDLTITGMKHEALVSSTGNATFINGPEFQTDGATPLASPTLKDRRSARVWLWDKQRRQNEQDSFVNEDIHALCYKKKIYLARYPKMLEGFLSRQSKNATPSKMTPTVAYKQAHPNINWSMQRNHGQWNKNWSMYLNAHWMIDPNITDDQIQSEIEAAFPKLNRTAKEELRAMTGKWLFANRTYPSASIIKIIGAPNFHNAPEKQDISSGKGRGPAMAEDFSTTLPKDLCIARWAARTFWSNDVNCLRLSPGANMPPRDEVLKFLYLNKNYYSFDASDSISSFMPVLGTSAKIVSNSGFWSPLAYSAGRWVFPSFQPEKVAGAAHTCPIRFWDSQRQKWLYVVDIDVSKLPGGLYYVNLPLDPRSTLDREVGYGLRLINGSSVNVNGFVLVTNGPLYIQDSFNIGNAPVVLIADSVSVLSGTWDDSKSRLEGSFGPNPVICACLITGALHKTNPVHANESIRLLQEGSQSAIQFMGSLIQPYSTLTCYNNASFNIGSLYLTRDTNSGRGRHLLCPSLEYALRMEVIPRYRECAEGPTVDISSLLYASLKDLLKQDDYWLPDRDSHFRQKESYSQKLTECLRTSLYPCLN